MTLSRVSPPPFIGTGLNRTCPLFLMDHNPSLSAQLFMGRPWSTFFSSSNLEHTGKYHLNLQNKRWLYIRACLVFRVRYHSHHSYQYVDGAWGFLIVDNVPAEVWGNSYDDEIHISINDWLHRDAADLTETYLTTGRFPVANSSLINGRGTFNCSQVEPGQICDPDLQNPAVVHVDRWKTYRIRILCASGAVAYNFSIDGHRFRVIETDGVDTEISPEVDVAFILPAQRLSILVTMVAPLSEYWIRITGQLGPVIGAPNLNALAVLKYTSAISENPENFVVPENDFKPNEEAMQGRPDFEDIPWGDIMANGGISPPTAQQLQQFFPNPPPSPVQNKQEERDREHGGNYLPQLPTTEPVDPSVAILLDQNQVPPYAYGGSNSAPNYYDRLIVVNVDDCPIPGSPARQCMNGEPFVPGSTTSLPLLFQVIQGNTVESNYRPVETPYLREVTNY